MLVPEVVKENLRLLELYCVVFNHVVWCQKCFLTFNVDIFVWVGLTALLSALAHCRDIDLGRGLLVSPYAGALNPQGRVSFHFPQTALEVEGAFWTQWRSERRCECIRVRSGLSGRTVWGNFMGLRWEMATLSCRVQFLEDTDPFVCTNFPEPRRPPQYDFSEHLALIQQITGVHKLLQAPLKVLSVFLLHTRETFQTVYNVELITKTWSDIGVRWEDVIKVPGTVRVEL